MTGRRPALFAALLALGLVATAAQADPAGDAMAASKEFVASVAGLKKAESARDRIAALTRTIQAYEAGLEGLRTALRAAELREAALQGDLAARQAQISRLLGAMIAIDAVPKPLALVHPDGALKSVEAAIVLEDVTPELQARAVALKLQLNEVSRLKASRQAAEAALRQGMGAARAARTALSEAISNRVKLPRRMIDDPAALQRLAAAAKTMTDFAAALKADPDAAPGFAAEKGRLALPVAGRIVLGPGEADARGVKRPGIAIATLPGALVVAPWAATVRYVGPLVDYGNVMVLDPGEGYLIVLAGMDRLYAGTGDVVRANAPLGVMAGGNAVEPEPGQVQQTGAEASERLYLELRKGARPIDPTGWFAAGKGPSQGPSQG